MKCGVIGSGWWATYTHIPALLANPNAEWGLVQSDDREQAHRIARDFNVPKVCVTVDELLAIDGLQAVVIGSPPSFHYEQALAALAKGLHVLVEKTMTITLARRWSLKNSPQNVDEAAGLTDLQFIDCSGPGNKICDLRSSAMLLCR